MLPLGSLHTRNRIIDCGAVVLALSLSIWFRDARADQNPTDGNRCETLFVAEVPRQIWTRPVLERTGPIRAAVAFMPMLERTKVLDPARFASTVFIPPRVVDAPTEAEIREQSVATKRERFRPKSILRDGYKISGLLAETSMGRKPIKEEILPVSFGDGKIRRKQFDFEVLRIRTYRSREFIVEISEVLSASRLGQQSLREMVELILHGIGPKEQKLIEEGNRRLIEIVDEVNDLAFPLYEELRGWSAANREELRKKAHATARTTRLIRIRTLDRTLVGSGGETEVTYGKVKFFDKIRQQWIEMMGPFGTAYDWTEFGVDPIVHGLIANPILWNKSVAQAPAEAFFGPDAFFPRPTTPDDSLSWESYELKHFVRTQKIKFPKGYEPDLDQPIFVSTGRLIEPVKLVIAKHIQVPAQPSDGSRPKTLKERMRGTRFLSPLSVEARILVLVNGLEFFFPEGMGAEFNLEGQIGVTYNPIEGARDKIGLYTRLGFSVYDGIQPREVDGQLWYPMIATPASILKAIAGLRSLGPREAQELLDELTERYGP